ncbi:hypothetical protein Pse7367_1467 [Thalassoporum mexicanum PCC 7367]|uniref:hypothetical protein n=1 Tax=Thalassoporum mexicanum TaxID=3457544 RepID=UPI00029FEFB0|nr:hypothetical protein [Pseudanabaena sp. PCC 7367]AFY69758.1 hypothetical protein Pse7367_1467 [Pseudanabaena sp. PCC 7367]
MTPTLYGRWQTRLLLMLVVGGLITLPFAAGWIGPGGSQFFWILGYLIFFGFFFWDPLYNYVQSFRWDRDWPAALQFLAGLWEAFFIVLLIKIFQLPLLGDQELPLSWFICHYSLVWLGIFIVSQSLMRLIFPRWRFRGGQWL